MKTPALMPVSNWTEAMVRVADGGLIRGVDVASLPWVIVAGEQPIYRRANYDARRLRALTTSAMALARRIDDGDWWLMKLLDFRGELNAATADRRPIASDWRTFAWHLGMTADFAAGLERAGLAWWGDQRNAGGRAQRATTVGSEP